MCIRDRHQTLVEKRTRKHRWPWSKVPPHGEQNRGVFFEADCFIPLFVFSQSDIGKQACIVINSFLAGEFSTEGEEQLLYSILT